jgi:phosphoribosylformylglycinamidine cyclo-ligase
VKVKAMSHITGGGITENLDRALPKSVNAEVVPAAWKVPRTVVLAVEAAGLSEDEAFKTFNMGIGFALILEPSEAPKAAALLREVGETVYEIGEIVAGEGKVVYR